MNKLTGQDFRARWDNSDLFDGIHREVIGLWNLSLAPIQNHHLAQIEIPASAKSFLTEIGLPEKIPALSLQFDSPSLGIHAIHQVRPTRIDNGVELPPKRYELFYQLGYSQAETAPDLCIAKYSGHIYQLHYGEKAFRQKILNESSAWTHITTESPIITNEVHLNPFFVSSSVLQFAYLLLTLRDGLVTEGVRQALLETKPKTLKNLLKNRMKKVDPVAILHPDSYWHFILDMVGDGIF